MGYFANSAEASIYERRFCRKCAHYDWCGVLHLHFLWGYDAVGANADEVNEVKAEALNIFIPSEGGGNGKCKMFIEERG